jgi:hypothetical protein
MWGTLIDLCYVGISDGIVLFGERCRNYVMCGAVLDLFYVGSGDGILLCGGGDVIVLCGER